MDKVSTVAKGSVAARTLIPLGECGIPRSSLYKAIGEGRGPDVVKIGRRSYITAEAWEAWVRNLPRLQSRKPKTPAANFLSPSPRAAPNPTSATPRVPEIDPVAIGRAAAAEVAAKYARARGQPGS